MKKTIITYFMLVGLGLMLVSCPTTEAIRQGYRITFTIDETTDTDVVVSHTYASLTDPDINSNYMLNYYSNAIGGNSGTIAFVSNSNTQNKLVSFGSYAQFSDSTSDGSLQLSLTPLDLTNDKYGLSLIVNYKYNSSSAPTEESYQLYIAPGPTAAFTKSFTKGTAKSVYSFTLDGPFTATKMSANPMQTAQVKVRNISVSAYVISASNEKTPNGYVDSPSFADEGVSRTPNIQLTFSKSMDTSNTTLYVNNNQMSGTWSDDKTLTYTPSSPLPANTKIWVDIPETHKASDGEPMFRPISSYFTTGS